MRYKLERLRVYGSVLTAFYLVLLVGCGSAPTAEVNSSVEDDPCSIVTKKMISESFDIPQEEFSLRVERIPEADMVNCRTKWKKATDEDGKNPRTHIQFNVVVRTSGVTVGVYDSPAKAREAVERSEWQSEKNYVEGPWENAKGLQMENSTHGRINVQHGNFIFSVVGYHGVYPLPEQDNQKGFNQVKDLAKRIVKNL